MNLVGSILVLIFLFCAPVAFAADSRDSLIDIQVRKSEKVNSKEGKTLTDGRAHVYKVQGRAVITKQGSPIEVEVKAGTVVKAGDAIYTEKNASVSIAFDYLKKNAVHIPAESRVVFNSIEPNDIKLENGSVFNAVGGLAEGSVWKVTTPVAVAAVRGTVYLVRFETATGEFYAATVDVPDDGKTSAIEIQLIDKDGEAYVPEGKEITLREGETPSSEMVQDLSPEAIAEIQQFFEQLTDEQEIIEEIIEQAASDEIESETTEETNENGDSSDDSSNQDNGGQDDDAEQGEESDAANSTDDESGSSDDSVAGEGDEDGSVSANGLGDDSVAGEWNDDGSANFDNGDSGMEMMDLTESPIMESQPELVPDETIDLQEVESSTEESGDSTNTSANNDD